MNNQSEIQNPKSGIVIVGAGPAGASAAIRLAQRGFRVRLIERERFPRQKLCGEFVSPECFAHFRALGVFEEMMNAGGDRIAETVFYAPGGKSVSVSSKWFRASENALGLSRAEMDLKLLERAKKIGVEVLEDAQVTNLIFENAAARGVKVKNKAGETVEIFADLIVDASGRGNVLAKMAEREKLRTAKVQSPESKVQNPNEIQNQKSKIKNRLVGFKAHLKNVEIKPGVCEIYFFPGGYGGLNFVENGVGNHCFLIRADIVKKFGGEAKKIIEKIVFQNTRAAKTLKNAVPIYEWLAVAIDGFGLKNLNPARNLLAVGDAGAFIDPFTGSGMLMAFESAEILAQSVAEDFSFGQIAENYQRLHRRKFQKRLRVCSLLRRAALAPRLTRTAINLLSLGEFPRKILARATRTDFSTIE